MTILFRRFSVAVLSIFLVLTLSFFALRLLPGDAIQTVLIGSGASEETIEARRTALGLDQPLFSQYTAYLSGILRGDLGVSLLSGRTVSEIITQQLGHTLSLGVSALIVAIITGVFLGAIAEYSVGYGLSSLAKAIIALSLSLPTYWTGTIVIFIFVAQLNLLPLGGANSIERLIMPSVVLGFHTAGAIAQTFRAEIITIKNSDYIRTAYAKGQRKSVVFMRHLLPNTLIPLVTVIALQAGFIFSGVVLTESVFVRPGLGRELISATMQQDYPVVQGIVLWGAVIYITLNTLVEMLYTRLDPRLRN